MSYSRYFGMRSFENVVRSGRFRSPVAGDGTNPIKIGAPVVIDPASTNNAFFKPAAAGEAPGANCGIAIFEHIQNKSDALTTSYDAPYDEVPNGQYAQMMRGPGTKVWFQNQAAKTMYDGRVRPAGGLLAASVNVATLDIGAGLIPDGAGKYAVATTEDPWLIVEQVNPNTGVVEARLTF